MNDFLKRNWGPLAIGGAILAYLYTIRKYLAVLLVLTVTTCTYKADIGNFITTTRDQGHQERMAVIKAQTDQERLKVEGEVALAQTRAQAETQIAQTKAAAEAQAQADARAKAKTQQAAPRAAVPTRYVPSDASNLAISVQNARAEQFRLVGVRDSLYTQYRTAQYYGNADDARKYQEQVALYDSYIAEQASIIRKLTQCGSTSVVACQL